MANPAPQLRPLALVGIWSVPATLSVAQEYLYSRMAGHPITLLRDIGTEAPAWYAWVLVTPAIVWLVNRRPLSWPPTARVLWPHLALLIAGTVFYCAIYVTANRALAVAPPTHSWLQSLAQSTLGWFSVTILCYTAVAGVALWAIAARRARERELQAAALAAELARAQLDALRAQLHPHFLFNTLNTIAILVREQDTDTAVGLLAQLSDILRQVLRQDTTHEVPLRSEIAFLTQYLGIEQVRFQDRLSVEWAIDDNALDVPVPSLILQPLVENALRHGIARRPESGRVTIGATLADARLTLWVADDGPGPPTSAAPRAEGAGLGLTNTRARLARHYGDAARLTLAANGTTVATIELPVAPR
jgi:two-component system LytT family sensor kinase